MKARDLERLLVGEGAGASKVSTIMGQLRESGRLPIAGRGLNAPAIDARQAATMLAAVAGSSRANIAGKRIEMLEGLKLDGEPTGSDFIEKLTALLSDPLLCAEVEEVRVARTIGRAVIIYRDGKTDEFLGGKSHDLNRRFRSVGELPGGLIEMVAKLLPHPFKKRKPKRRRHSDW